jgi:hypothetical protein
MRDYDLKSEFIVLRNYIRNREFALSVLMNDVISEHHFIDRLHRDIFLVLTEYYTRYGIHIPEKSHIMRMLAKGFTRLPKYKEQQQKRIWLSGLSKIYKGEIEQHEITKLESHIDILESLRQSRLLKGFLIDSRRLYDKGSFLSVKDKIPELMNNLSAKDNEVIHGDIVSDYNKNLISYKSRMHSPPAIGTGIVGVAEYGDNLQEVVKLDYILHGGLRPKQVAIILGENNIGKSFVLMEVGYHAAKWQKKNVLLVTIEMEKESQQLRIYSRDTGIKFNKFYDCSLTKEDRAVWRESIEKWKKDNCGLYYVVSMTKASVPDIEKIMREIEISLSVKFDLLVIDYLNDMIPSDYRQISRSKNWDVQGTISWELVKLSKSWNNGQGIPILTANQRKTKIEQGRKHGLLWSDGAYSPLVMQHAAIVIGISFDEMGIELNRMTWNVIKSRFSSKKTKKSLRVFYTFPRFEVARVSSMKRAREYYGDTIV